MSTDKFSESYLIQIYSILFKIEINLLYCFKVFLKTRKIDNGYKYIVHRKILTNSKILSFKIKEI